MCCDLQHPDYRVLAQVIREEVEDKALQIQSEQEAQFMAQYTRKQVTIAVLWTILLVAILFVNGLLWAEVRLQSWVLASLLALLCIVPFRLLLASRQPTAGTLSRYVASYEHTDDYETKHVAAKAIMSALRAQTPRYHDFLGFIYYGPETQPMLVSDYVNRCGAAGAILGFPVLETLATLHLVTLGSDRPITPTHVITPTELGSDVFSAFMNY